MEKKEDKDDAFVVVAVFVERIAVDDDARYAL